jgi:hypothetical protein
MAHDRQDGGIARPARSMEKLSMRLVLTLKADQDLYIGDHRFLVTRARPHGRFHLERCTDGQAFPLADDRRAEVLPGVFCSARDNAAGRSQVRMALEAPPDLPILRGTARRRTQPDRLDGRLENCP